MAEEGPGRSGPPRPDQWLPAQLRSGPEKGEKRGTALGSGALHFIRTRSSIRRELKRHSNQSKASENLIVSNENCNGGGGGLGKWLWEHLGGSRGNHEVNSSSVKRNSNRNGDSTVEKSVPRLTYASQNLYCSLPREHGRPPINSAGQKVSQANIQGHNRPRSNTANFSGKNTPPTPVPPVIRRGGPVYSSDGKSMRRRNRDRRRHSLNEAQEAQEKRRRETVTYKRQKIVSKTKDRTNDCLQSDASSDESISSVSRQFDSLVFLKNVPVICTLQLVASSKHSPYLRECRVFDSRIRESESRRMDNLPETSTNDAVLSENAVSKADELSPALGATESKDFMKMLTFAPDVPGSEVGEIRLNVTVDSLIDNANDNQVQRGGEEGGNDEGEDEEEEKENRTNRIEEDEEVEEGELPIDEEDRAKEEEEDEKEGEEEEEEEEEDEEEEEEEDEDGEEEHHPDEEKILMDYSFQTTKEIKIKSDNDLSKIPSEIYYDRNAMLQILKDLVIERPSLMLRNRYLEFKCYKYLQSTEITGSHLIDDGSNLEDEAERGRYMNSLRNYKKESELFRARENEIKLSLDNLREKLKDRWSKDANSFAELTSREMAVAVDLVFATTGRRLTQKRVEDIIRRQTCRRKLVAHERYTFIRQWYTFEEIDAKIRRLETLGPGMKITDYETDFSTKITAQTKIDERNKELQKARARVCGIMTAITHGKVKLAFLRDEIELEKNRYHQILDSVHRRREELSTMRSRLSVTRNRYIKKRETAGLMLALPTLREMERVKNLRDTWKQRVNRLRSSVFKPGRRDEIEKKDSSITNNRQIPEPPITLP